MTHLLDQVRRVESKMASAGRSTFDGGTSWLFGGYDHTWYNHALTPNAATPDCSSGRGIYGTVVGAMTARSYHPGGVHVSFGDGSVRFINDRVDLIVWRGISSRNGREVVATDF